jgi:hypothetical protein
MQGKSILQTTADRRSSQLRRQQAKAWQNFSIQSKLDFLLLSVYIYSG